MKVQHVPYNGLDINTVMAAARAALTACRWKFSEYQWRLVASVPFNLLSYGEEVEIRFYQDSFDISSKCIFPLQVIDWGKNQSNIRKFLNAYQNCLQQNFGGGMQPY